MVVLNMVVLNSNLNHVRDLRDNTSEIKKFLEVTFSCHRGRQYTTYEEHNLTGDIHVILTILHIM